MSYTETFSIIYMKEVSGYLSVTVPGLIVHALKHSVDVRDWPVCSPDSPLHEKAESDKVKKNPTGAARERKFNSRSLLKCVL